MELPEPKQEVKQVTVGPSEYFDGDDFFESITCKDSGEENEFKNILVIKIITNTISALVMAYDIS